MPDLLTLLRSTFGHSAFRANQEAVCRAATEGSDVLLVMPTGAGKSLCYQLPALARGGTALVVSPLIALMDDQAAKLCAAGLRVARIHSGLSREDARQACRDYLDGRLQFLFIAPERMRVPGFPEMLARRKPSLIAIDEAHCISAWGHDFRPDYRMLGEHLPALRPAPILALTATATPAVQKDIVAQLGLVKPALFIHGFRRDNLAIEVVQLSKPQRKQFTTDFLAPAARRPAIVYAPSRKAAEELAAELNQSLAKRPAAGEPAVSSSRGMASASEVCAPYHAGLETSVRERVQRDFQSGKLEVVVATIAFGMGIDKADVRTVVHYALPASVEAYYQEIGRAGRDGQPSRTVLLYSFADRKMHDFFLDRDYPPATELARVAAALTDEFLMPDYLASRLRMDRDSVGKILEKLAAQGAAQFDMAGNVRGGADGNARWHSGYEQQVQFRREQIDRMMQFAENPQCRMTALIRHFGDLADAHRPCGHCDFCAPGATEAQSSAEPTAAQERDLRSILRALEGGLSKSTGRLHTELAANPREMRDANTGKALDRRGFDALLDGLARAGLLSISQESFTNSEGNVIAFKKASLTHEGETCSPSAPLGVLLRAGFASDGKAGAKSSKKSNRKSAPASADIAYTPTQQSLDETVRAWRKQEAAKSGKPAFLVFSDATLRALVRESPHTLSALHKVAGFGPDKVERYGAAVCALCRGESDGIESLTARPLAMKPAQAPSASRRPSPSPSPATSPAAPREFRRAQPHAAAPAETLTSAQQALEIRLRAWRKAEAEKMGLPQFFVLGTSTLRSIVLNRPLTLGDLRNIQGVERDKLDRFGSSILELCNS